MTVTDCCLASNVSVDVSRVCVGEGSRACLWFECGATIA